MIRNQTDFAYKPGFTSHARGPEGEAELDSCEDLSTGCSTTHGGPVEYSGAIVDALEYLNPLTPTGSGLPEHLDILRTAVFVDGGLGKVYLEPYVLLLMPPCSTYSGTLTQLNGNSPRISVCRDIEMPPPYGTMAFAAWFEVSLDNSWHIFDARNNKPYKGRILIARGHDAADVAISSTFGPNTLKSCRVWCDEVVSVA